MDVHRDEGAAQPPRRHRRFARFLDRGVERELQVVAWDRRLRQQLPVRGRLPERVDLDFGQSRLAAEEGVVGVLDSVLSDFVAGLEGLVLGFLELFFVDLADLAEDVGGQGPIRVVADEDPLHRDPREEMLVLLHVVDEVVANVLPQSHRGAGRGHHPFVDRLLDPVGRRVGEFGELGELGLPSLQLGRQLVGVDLDREAGAIVDQNLAIAIEDRPARRADPELTGPVVPRLGEVFLPVQDLEEPEAKEEDDEEGEGDAAEQSQPHRKAVVHLRPALV